eukprot:gene9612-12970_t
MSDRVSARRDGSSLSAATILTSTNRQRKIAEKDMSTKGKRSSAISAKRLRVDMCIIAEDRIDTESSSFSESELRNFIDNVTNTSDLKTMREIRNILSLGKVEAIQVTIDCDFIRFLTSLLTNPNEELRIEAVWCLTNIAAGSFEQTEAVISAMPRLIQILSSDVEAAAIKEQVCWTIGNIAGECDEFRATLLAN